MAQFDHRRSEGDRTGQASLRTAPHRAPVGADAGEMFQLAREKSDAERRRGVRSRWGRFGCLNLKRIGSPQRRFDRVADCSTIGFDFNGNFGAQDFRKCQNARKASPLCTSEMSFVAQKSHVRPPRRRSRFLRCMLLVRGDRFELKSWGLSKNGKHFCKMVAVSPPSVKAVAGLLLQ